MTISTKAANYDLWLRGRFGNLLRVWESLEALDESGYSGLVTMRYKSPASPWMRYAIPLEDVRPQALAWVLEGADLDLMVFSETLPDRETLQGEFDGLHLHFSRARGLKMRDALRDHGEHADGPGARLLLKAALDPASYEDLMSLVEDWPGHVVEFSAYGCDIGTIPGRNTIIWEVRAY